MIRMCFQRGMQHPVDRGIFAQEGQHGSRVLHMTLHAQRQRLHALQQMKGVGGRKTGAEIAQTFGARPHDKGGGTELLGKDDAVIAGIGLGQGGKFARACQSKRPPSTIAPPMAMPWPPIHLVMECMTISAPSVSGRLR